VNETRKSIAANYSGRLFLSLVCLALASSGAGELRGGENETREFKVSVDGKPRGKCTIGIESRDDGADVMHINAALSFNYVVYEYRYSSVGSEVWKEGRLIELENTADFNGTKYVVTAGTTKKGLRVTVDGKSSLVQPDVWATSYWQLPQHLSETKAGEDSGVIPAGGRRTARTPAVSVALLDTDKGKKLRGQLQRVGEEMVVVAGKKKPCTHYRVAGDVDVNVWYDARQRLVRQESVDSGHKTVMELVRVAAE
jgi:hypothetical protein